MGKKDKFKHHHTDYGTNPAFRQHFVSDGDGRPFLRTLAYFRGSQDDEQVGEWLDRAVAAMNEVAHEED